MAKKNTTEEENDMPPTPPLPDEEPQAPLISEFETETYVKVIGQEYAYKAINIVRQDGWIAFDRVNTKTGLVAAHLEFPMSKIESIEKR